MLNSQSNVVSDTEDIENTMLRKRLLQIVMTRERSIPCLDVFDEAEYGKSFQSRYDIAIT